MPARSSRSRRTASAMSLWKILAVSFFAATATLRGVPAFVPITSQANSKSKTSMGVAKSGGRLITAPEEFESVVLAQDSKKPVLAFFSAPWCGPCRLTNPVVKEIMKQFAGQIDVVELCTDDLAEIASAQGVTSIPTIHFYHQGRILDTIVGCVAKSVLANAVEKVLEDAQAARSPPPTS